MQTPILLLHIETSGEICSVCLTKDGRVVKELSAVKERSHSKRLTLLIEELCQASLVSLSMLSAIVLSKGPGSYTGLRVGSSVAKGLCFSLDIPIITLNTLTAMASKYRDKNKSTLIIPMILARKEEVYLQVLDGNLDVIKGSEPVQLSEDVLDPYLNSNTKRVVICGNAAQLAQSYLSNKTAIEFYQSEPTAHDLTDLSIEMYNQQVFDDIAYFDLDYIKSPHITTSKKKTLVASSVKK